MSLAFELELPLQYEPALHKTIDALKAEGFGVLTRIDVHTTMKEKLGVRFPQYTILGACNPTLAHRALSADARAGLLLPCNVTVEASDEAHSIVRIVDPIPLLTASGLAENPGLSAVARDAHAHLARVAESLRGSVSANAA